jgi:hypothetical protein
MKPFVGFSKKTITENLSSIIGGFIGLALGMFFGEFFNGITLQRHLKI